MLYVFGFESTAVVLGDLYFHDPDPLPGQEGAERGVRLEVRLLERGALPGTIYSARPIGVGAPLWRADLLESFDGPPGTFDRTHHHPDVSGWELGERAFVVELSAEPLKWVGTELGDLDRLVARAGVDPSVIDPGDAAAMREAVPEILDAIGRVLARVQRGELARVPSGGDESYRSGWL